MLPKSFRHRTQPLNRMQRILHNRIQKKNDWLSYESGSYHTDIKKYLFHHYEFNGDIVRNKLFISWVNMLITQCVWQRFYSPLPIPKPAKCAHILYRRVNNFPKFRLFRQRTRFVVRMKRKYPEVFMLFPECFSSYVLDTEFLQHEISDEVELDTSERRNE